MKEDLFNQAKNYRRVTKLDTDTHESYIYKGIKIMRDKETNEIVIYNAQNSDFYKEISQEEYHVMFDKGFRYGVYSICLDHYNKTLAMLKKKISNEVNGRNNQKHYNALKEYRSFIMSKYTGIIKLKKEINTYECERKE